MEELVLTDPVVKPEEVSNKLRVVSFLLNHDTISVGSGFRAQNRGKS